MKRVEGEAAGRAWVFVGEWWGRVVDEGGLESGIKVTRPTRNGANH